MYYQLAAGTRLYRVTGVGVNWPTQPYSNRSNLLRECNLEFQFLQRSPRRAVTALTVDIDWCNPRFKISGVGATIPAYGPRPHTKVYNPNRWYNLAIQFA